MVTAHIISDLLKRPFSARQSAEQNIIVTQHPMPNIQISATGGRSFQVSWYTNKDWLCGSLTNKAVILSWNFINMDEDWLQKYKRLSVRLPEA